MPRILDAVPAYLRVAARGDVRVDREKKVLRGFVVAQAGPFKTPGRGEFDKDSLAEIVRLWPAKGLRSRFTHPTECDDGLGKFLGRAKNPRVDGDRVRADLYLAEAAFKSPAGDLGGYVLDLAEEDSDALSSSLVLSRKEEFRIDKAGRPLKDKDGKDLPPLWRPTKIHATDIVDTGDAVDGLLSVDALPDSAVFRGAELLDRLFASTPDDVVRARCLAWLDRYLALRAGTPTPTVPETRPATPMLDEYRKRLKRAGLHV